MNSIRRLGLVAALALALSASVGAASASAVQFESASSETTFQGTGSGDHFVSLAGFTLKCSKVGFSGKGLGTSLSAITVKPTLGDCIYLGANTQFSMGGCNYTFHASGEFDIAGAKCASEPILYALPGCTITIGPQTGLKGVKYVNVGTGTKQEITATAALSGITYSASGISCAEKGTNLTNGKYEGQWQVSGIATHSVAANITGKQLEAQKLTLAGGQLNCQKATYKGGTTAVSTGYVVLTPSYAECSFLGSNVTVEMRGCTFVLHFDGKFDVAGPTCAAEPMRFASPGCTVTIGPQSGLSAMSFSESWWNHPASVTVTPGVSSLTYTSSGFICPKKGTFSSGVYSGKYLLEAIYSGGTQVAIRVS